MKKIPFHEILNATLLALHKLDDSGRNQEIHDRAVRILGLSEEEIAKPLKPGQSTPTEIAYRLGWARTFLRHYGLLQNSSRGVWALTVEGKKTTKVDGREVERVVNEKLRQERLGRTVGKPDDAGDSIEVEDLTGEEEWRGVLRDALLRMEASAFERLCQQILRESGFTQVDVTGKSGDGGIDGIGVMRLGGFLSFRVLFQCKRYKGSVSASTVRDFRGAMTGRTDKGLIVTTGSFTRDAIREATRDGAPEIDLVDGEQLIETLKDLSLGVETKEVITEQVTVDPDFFANI